MKAGAAHLFYPREGDDYQSYGKRLLSGYPEMSDPSVSPVLSIVIVTWNTRDLTLALLRSLFRSAPESPFEVIVVDNASIDGTADEIAQHFPRVVLVRNNANAGFASGNNQALRISSGRYILLLGSDTEMIDNSIQRMLEFLSTSEVGAVSCRLLNPDRTPQRSCRRFPTLWDGLMTYLSLDGLAPHYTMKGFDYYKTQDVEQPAATCLMLKRKVIDEAGMFDERYAILYNDVDLCKRIRDRGWRIVYLASAEVIHHGSRSTTQAPPGVRLEMYRNILLYYSAAIGAHARLVLLPVLLVRLLVVTGSPLAFRLLLPQSDSHRSLPEDSWSHAR